MPNKTIYEAPAGSMQSADDVRRQITIGVDAAVAAAMEDEKARLLAAGVPLSELENAQPNDELAAWRDATIEDLFRKAVRFIAAPDAPSKAVH